MKILSLFDGLSCAQQALKELGVECEYYASEIDPYAIAVTQSNFPNTVQLGSVVGLSVDFQPDLLIGGSPCQDLSIAKKNREGLAGSRSGLFWEYVRIRDEVKPKYFVLENVASMPKEAKQIITDALGVEPVMIDAALVSAQRRKRLFWVGKLVGDKYEQVHIDQPEDRGILLKDILESGGVDREKGHCLDANYWKGTSENHYKKKGVRQIVYVAGRIIGRKINERGVRDDYNPNLKAVQRFEQNEDPRKTNTISTVAKDNMLKGDGIRKLTTTECLRLQSLPDDYFDRATYKGRPISSTQRYKMVGNSFNCQVIQHILKEVL